MTVTIKKERVAKRVGDYMLGRTLGKGTYGKVKLGTHITSGEEVAVKIVEAKDTVHSEEVEREIHVLKLLKHPNIVRLIDVIRDFKRTYIVLELINGGELFDRIVADEFIPEDDARKLFRQMISALEYCHGNLICHRDLKPENMLMDINGNIKISDFGFSNFIQPGMLLKTSCGSPVYAAPEILENVGYVGTVSDIWSLGVVLFAMVTGHLPSEDMTHLSEGDVISIPNRLSKELSDLLSKMLQVCPSKRATMHEIKFHPWVNIDYEKPPPCYLEHRRVRMDRVNEEVLKQLIPLKLDIDQARQSILNNEQCLATSIYHLFMEQMSRKFDRSISTRASRRMTVSLESSPVTSSDFGFDDTMGSSTERVGVSIFDNGMIKRRVSLDTTGIRPASAGGGQRTFAPSLATLSESDEESGESPNTSRLKGKLTKKLSFIMNKFTKAKMGSPLGNSEKVISFDVDRADGDVPGMRKLKQSKNVVIMKNKTPYEIVVLLQGALVDCFVQYEQKGYLAQCRYYTNVQAGSPRPQGVEVTFDMEVCQVKKNPNFGVRLKRRAGDVWAYKSIYQELSTKLAA